KSELVPLLGRVSRMPVHEVTEGMAVEVDHVYVIPPATNMAMSDGHLTLTPRAPRPMPHMPIDHLLRSLAAIQKDRSVGVILSGRGSGGGLAAAADRGGGGGPRRRGGAGPPPPGRAGARRPGGHRRPGLAPRGAPPRAQGVRGPPYPPPAGGAGARRA